MPGYFVRHKPHPSGDWTPQLAASVAEKYIDEIAVVLAQTFAGKEKEIADNMVGWRSRSSHGHDGGVTRTCHIGIGCWFQQSVTVSREATAPPGLGAHSEAAQVGTSG